MMFYVSAVNECMFPDCDVLFGAKNCMSMLKRVVCSNVDVATAKSCMF